MQDLATYQIGKSDELLRIGTRDECRDVTLAIAAQASHSLAIFSHDLEPDLYNSSKFIDAARHVLASDSHASIRILVFDISRIIQTGHKLIHLSRSQTSRVQIRQLPQPYHHAFMVADNIAVLDRRRAERFEATANFNDAGWAGNLLHFFDTTWEKSARATESQRLGI